MTRLKADQTKQAACEGTRKYLLAGAGLSITAFLAATSHSTAHNNQVTIQQSQNQRCIISNGLPDHGTGSFPNRGNPHRISEQNVRLCVAKNPIKSNQAKQVRGSVGVALNGVQIRPGTADWYDPNSHRGHSRNRSSGWNLEGLGAAEKLGMDHNNAHVDQRGLYHYHGVSGALKRQGNGSLIGYAADGFEIHYLGKKRTSSYKLKQGQRPSGPGGRYDGTYVEDWHYVAGSGDLDRCNGGILKGKFVYFATDSYPFFPRCLWGTASRDFLHGRAAGRGQSDQPPQGQFSGPGRSGTSNHSHGTHGANGQRSQFDQPERGQNQHMAQSPLSRNRFGPPPEALQACMGKNVGANCRMQTPRGRLSGSCIKTPDQQKACLPTGHRHRH